MRIVVLIPAHNEAASIGTTLESVVAQTRQADRVVVIPNGCTDDTAKIARKHGVTVMETPALPNRKAEALNAAWHEYARHADIVVCLDADSILAPNAIECWEREFASDLSLAGSSGRFSMTGSGALVRLQRHEFATYTDAALRHGSTSILAGAGCAISGMALDEVASLDDGREGPWSYDTPTEDYELTYQIRREGWKCHVSPTVRVHTDAMPTAKALWAQRMKWSTGIIGDLMAAGFNRHTARDWMKQVFGLLSILLRVIWLLALGATLTTTTPLPALLWLVPVLVAMLNVLRAFRIKDGDWKDAALAAAFLPHEVMVWLWCGWTLTSWVAVIRERITGKRKDRWTGQYEAEGHGIYAH